MLTTLKKSTRGDSIRCELFIAMFLDFCVQHVHPKPGLCTGELQLCSSNKHWVYCLSISKFNIMYMWGVFSRSHKQVSRVTAPVLYKCEWWGGEKAVCRRWEMNTRTTDAWAATGFNRKFLKPQINKEVKRSIRWKQLHFPGKHGTACSCVRWPSYGRCLMDSEGFTARDLWYTSIPAQFASHSKNVKWWNCGMVAKTIEFVHVLGL